MSGSAAGDDRNAAVLALGGRHHPVAPVLGDVGHPVAGEVDRRGVPRRRRGGAALLLRAHGCRPGERQEDQRDAAAADRRSHGFSLARLR